MKKNLIVNPVPLWQAVHYRFLVAALLLTLIMPHASAQSLLLKDINKEEDVENNEFKSLTVGYNKVFFVNNFSELWRTTGSVSSTVRIKAFKEIDYLTNIGQTLYFSADDGSGMELWKSGGSLSSTAKVKEFKDGGEGGNPRHLTPGDGEFFFVATTHEHGEELWKSNGRPGGTVLVKDIQPGKRSGAPRDLTFMNGFLYFVANDGKNGYELWKSDGTSQGTVMVKDIRGGQYLGSEPKELRNVNGVLYFTAYEPLTGRELWRSSGTTATTALASDIRAGAGSPDIKNLTAVNNTLFFSANDGIHGHELWKCSGGNAVLVKDLTPGKAGSHGQDVFEHPMGNFTNALGQLYFTAYESDTYYIWKSDGTAEGTIPLEEARNGIATPEPRFVVMGTSIFYYNAPDRDVAYYGTELRRMNSDGSGSVVVAHLVQQHFYDRYNPELVTLNRSLYLWGRNDDASGFKLFRSNGIPGHLQTLNDSHKGTVGSNPYSFVRSGDGQMFFTAGERVYEPHYVWRTDGTPRGTIKIADQELVGSPSIVATNSSVYFTTYPGLSIWKTNGTPEGTNQVVSRAIEYSYVRSLVNVGEMLYVHMENHGLWRSDGTAAGTFQLTPAQEILFMKPVGNLLFYLARRNGQFELWRTTGRRSQTFKVLTFTDQGYTNLEPVVKDNILYFMANDRAAGDEIWRSDGTARGTFRIADINTNDVNSSPYSESDIGSMAAWEGSLYISALDNSNVWGLFKYDGLRLTRVKDLQRVGWMVPATGRLHLFPTVAEGTFLQFNHWVTDGTEEGTQMINDTEFFYGSFSFVIHDDILYFSSYGTPLWRSDGTACGTFPLDVGVTMSGSINNIGDQLIFAGSTRAYGMEPYAFDLSSTPPPPCEGATQSFSRITDDLTIDSYPNPFSKEFVINIQGTDKELIDVQVFTHSGFAVETISGLSANKEYRLGAFWQPGNYILRVNRNGRLTTYHVLKE